MIEGRYRNSGQKSHIIRSLMRLIAFSFIIASLSSSSMCEFFFFVFKFALQHTYIYTIYIYAVNIVLFMEKCAKFRFLYHVLVCELIFISVQVYYFRKSMFFFHFVNVYPPDTLQHVTHVVVFLWATPPQIGWTWEAFN